MLIRRTSAFAALAAALLLGGCNSDRLGPGFEGNIVGSPETVEYVPSLGVDLSQMTRSSTGLYVRDLAVGTGALAVDSSTVAVRYTGWLANGRQFDSGTIDRLVLDGTQVVPGFEEGIEGMRVGGTRQIVIPADLAYGNDGSGTVIPPGAPLIFRIDLLAASAPAGG